MATEEPVGFTADGELITAWRWSEADKADIMMAGEMYAASPDCQERVQRLLDGLPTVTVTFSGYFDGPEN